MVAAASTSCSACCGGRGRAGAYTTESLRVEASAYVNFIRNYIYFGPALDAEGMLIYDVGSRGAFPRFTTRPVDAQFWGADDGVTYAPIPELELGAQASLGRCWRV